VITIHIAPRKVYVSASVDFEDDVPVGAIERLIADTEASLRQAWPQIASVYIKPKAAVQSAGTTT
jgi:divalent metal cation (Fe/Co/Zn/Cd) transporter